MIGEMTGTEPAPVNESTLNAQRTVSWTALAWPGFTAAAVYAIVPCWTTLIAWPMWARRATAVALLLFPVLWLLVARFVAGGGRIRRWAVLDWRDWLILIGIVAALVWLQLPFLAAPLAWRGDEDYHVRRAELFAQSLHEGLTVYPWRWIACGVLFGAVAGARLTKRRIGDGAIAIIAGWAVAASATMTLEYVHATLYGRGGRLWIAESVFRYPPGGLALGAFFVSHEMGTLAAEWAHRMIAFLPYVAICGVTYASARALSAGRVSAVAASAIMALLPLTYYHAAIAYLDVAAVAVGCYIALLFLKHDRVDGGFVLRVASAAAALVPIKETALPIAVAATVVLALRVLISLEAAWYRRAAVALGAALLIAAPGVIYFSFVWIMGGVRPHPQNWDHLAQWQTYRHAAAGAWAQFGPAGCMAILIGLVMAALSVRTTWALAFGCMTAVLSAVVFYSDHPSYIGYSRFTLYFLPLILVAVASLARPLPVSGKYVGAVQTALLGAIAAASHFAAPRTLADRQNWGSLFTDTAEYYYPYPDAIELLSQRGPKATFCVSGGSFPYHVRFYLRKTGMEFRKLIAQNADQQSLEDAVRWTAANGARFLIFHRPEPVEGPPGETPAGAVFVERFTIGERAVDVYDTTGVQVSPAK